MFTDLLNLDQKNKMEQELMAEIRQKALKTKQSMQIRTKQNEKAGKKKIKKLRKEKKRGRLLPGVAFTTYTEFHYYIKYTLSCP